MTGVQTCALPILVILSDAFYPGWRARVDHRPAQIHEVNGALRGVAVPRGTHTVTMRYRPVSVYLGAALTLLGILGVLGWNWNWIPGVRE